MAHLNREVMGDCARRRVPIGRTQHARDSSLGAVAVAAGRTSRGEMGGQGVCVCARAWRKWIALGCLPLPTQRGHGKRSIVLLFRVSRAILVALLWPSRCAPRPPLPRLFLLCLQALHPLPGCLPGLPVAPAVVPENVACAPMRAAAAAAAPRCPLRLPRSRQGRYALLGAWRYLQGP